MRNAHIPVLGIAAYSGTGKTTLLTQLIPLLKQQGLRLGIIKHSHHSFEIDKPGKDSFRLRKAGASPVMLVSRHRRAVITEIESNKEPRLDDQLKLFDKTGLDLILVEGFKSERFPKIEIHRPQLNNPLLYPNDPSVIAIATDVRIAVPNNLINLDLNNPVTIADFIINEFLENTDV